MNYLFEMYIFTVRWHVISGENSFVSDHQLNMFRSLSADGGLWMQDNYRPVQANINPIYDCY